MFCCSELEGAVDLEMIVKSEVHRLRDGRVMNEINSEYFLRSAEESGRRCYLAFNYCPFCGRGLSRGLWVAEKKT
jgi:hypothetical protein